jgi:glycosyltransferase involved in cell wall biosynthesis
MPSLRPPKFTGLYHNESVADSFWIREKGILFLPGLKNASRLFVTGELLPPTSGDATTHGDLGVELILDGAKVLTQEKIAPGPFRLELPWPGNTTPSGHKLEIRITGVAWSNFLAWLGRMTRLGFLQSWRFQGRNRRLRIQRVEAGGNVLFDFSNRFSPWNFAISRSSLKVGLNLVGFYRAILGVGESVRCAARAADAADLPLACIELKLYCKNPQTDDTFASRLQPENPHPVNVFHLDAPVSRDIDHHHGESFRSGKYNIGYWAWELPDFPDSWIHFADYFDEIWTPSQFATEAIAQKVRVPVLTMPHAISFTRPEGNFRKKFGLPADNYLFLFIYDLNSYSERKNPAAALEAFRQSGLAEQGAALVVKVHNSESNAADYEVLLGKTADLPGTILINQVLSREEIYELESACDCFVSLHRSEGFGLAVAESMYLGKPVISTDWSATAEFVNATNGCPVRSRLVKLERHHGPYAKGQVWAEPDVSHAADWMKRLFNDRGLARQLGTAARATIEEKYSPAAIGARYRQRLEVIAGW